MPLSLLTGGEDSSSSNAGQETFTFEGWKQTFWDRQTVWTVHKDLWMADTSNTRGKGLKVCVRRAPRGTRDHESKLGRGGKHKALLLSNYWPLCFIDANYEAFNINIFQMSSLCKPGPLKCHHCDNELSL